MYLAYAGRYATSGSGYGYARLKGGVHRILWRFAEDVHSGFDGG